MPRDDDVAAHGSPHARYGGTARASQHSVASPSGFMSAPYLREGRSAGVISSQVYFICWAGSRVVLIDMMGAFLMACIKAWCSNTPSCVRRKAISEPASGSRLALPSSAGHVDGSGTPLKTISVHQHITMPSASPIIINRHGHGLKITPDRCQVV